LRSETSKWHDLFMRSAPLRSVELGKGKGDCSFGALHRIGGVALKSLSSHGGPRRGNQPGGSFPWIISITDDRSPLSVRLVAFTYFLGFTTLHNKG
jgi:hypothetical protein